MGYKDYYFANKGLTFYSWKNTQCNRSHSNIANSLIYNSRRLHNAIDIMSFIDEHITAHVVVLKLNC